MDILIADDDRLILATLARGLRNAGYQVFEAANGEQAVRIGIHNKPRLAILDSCMPDISGIEVAKYLNEATSIPFIFLSAYNDCEMVAEAIEIGALGYLVKPIDVPQIIPSIEAALKRAAEISKLKEDQSNLNLALSRGRQISVATGILMERYHLSEAEAFNALRLHARSLRRKLSDVAEGLVRAADNLNSVTAHLERHFHKLLASK
jgi:response regulator NasT